MSNKTKANWVASHPLIQGAIDAMEEAIARKEHFMFDKDVLAHKDKMREVREDKRRLMRIKSLEKVKRPQDES